MRSRRSRRGTFDFDRMVSWRASSAHFLRIRSSARAIVIAARLLAELASASSCAFRSVRRLIFASASMRALSRFWKDFQQRVRGGDERQARLFKFFDVALLRAKRFLEPPVLVVNLVAGGLLRGDPLLGDVVLHIAREQALPRIGEHLLRHQGARRHGIGEALESFGFALVLFPRGRGRLRLGAQPLAFGFCHGQRRVQKLYSRAGILQRCVFFDEIFRDEGIFSFEITGSAKPVARRTELDFQPRGTLAGSLPLRRQRPHLLAQRPGRCGLLRQPPLQPGNVPAGFFEFVGEVKFGLSGGKVEFCRGGWERSLLASQLRSGLLRCSYRRRPRCRTLRSKAYGPMPRPFVLSIPFGECHVWRVNRCPIHSA